ncbi:RraA family protein [Chondrinema litorale]|uniref:RraA family protein n=1 Tax=Chondrinema litorale TaxID=2994555 RepID=UPI0025437F26|nr:RraA family protein [Chondrinema litorale]UZR96638.1 RraA family protein [Chondrinema litorale]
MRYKNILKLILPAILFVQYVQAQTISSEELNYLTSAWKGERFVDGRPKIPESLIERAKKVSVEDVWTILKNEGYTNQYEGGWKTIDDKVVAGRALTAQFMPSRPDLVQNIKAKGKEDGRIGDTNAWPIDELSKGDVYVADGFGKIAGGTLIGSNLGNSIYSKSENGVVFDGSARDMDGLSEIEGFNAFVRDWHPSFLQDMVLTGLNKPIRIGQAVVMPGDLVLAKRAGVIFIPAHLAEKVIATAEFIVLKDKFGHAMLREGTFTTGEIDSQWNDKIKDEFIKWIKINASDVPLTRSDVDRFMEQRTW